ncbi:MAG: hypothetical protein AAF639_43730 [Chloroflexota bacterium]
MNESNLPITGTDLAGSLPVFPKHPDRISEAPNVEGMAGALSHNVKLSDFRHKRLLFNEIRHPGRYHVYSVDCRAGERLRVQMYVPVLKWHNAITPAFAVIAQSLPYSADAHKLPVAIPAGYSAVVAPPPNALGVPIRDALTHAYYYPGPLIDTTTLVSGRCYIIAWSPGNRLGKYVLQTGHRWPWGWTYWLQLPRFWWQIRGWFGLSRLAAYFVAAGLLAVGLWLFNIISSKNNHATEE